MPRILTVQWALIMASLTLLSFPQRHRVSFQDAVGYFSGCWSFLVVFVSIRMSSNSREAWSEHQTIQARCSPRHSMYCVCVKGGSGTFFLTDQVTWDEHSLFVRGERILFYSGEFHPFR